MSRRKVLLWTVTSLLVVVTVAAAGLFFSPGLLCQVLGNFTHRCSTDAKHPPGSSVEHGEASPAPGENARHDEVHGQAALAHNNQPKTSKSDIVRASREVVRQQSRMAEGDSDSVQNLNLAMTALTERFSKVGKTSLEGSEVEACAMFVMSGGSPASAQQCSNSDALSAKQKKLLEGVESYASGNLEKASELLGSLDPAEFEILLAARLLMAQAQMLPEAENEKAIHNLTRAANSVPGTLVEEAAIRRLVVRLAAAGEVKKFFYWSHRYARRFPMSLFYPDFEDGFVHSLISLPEHRVEEEREELSAVFRTLGKVRSSALARLILKSAIRQGKAGLCSTTVSAFGDAQGGEVASNDALSVLSSICTSVQGDAKQRQALRAISQDGLDAEIVRLLQSANKLGEIIDGELVPDLVDVIGPSRPLSADPAFADLIASVAQRLDDSLSASNRVSEDEGNSKAKP